MLSTILQELNHTNFPTNRSRMNVSTTPTKSFALGQVNYRGQACVGYKTIGPSRYNKKFPTLLDTLNSYMKSNNPEFEYTTIQVNKNIQSLPHFDRNNVGPSFIIALGNFTGGELVIEGTSYDVRKGLFFNGLDGHWVKPFTGTRYSLVFFTHTFKPPNPKFRGWFVNTTGLHNKHGNIIRKY